MWWQLIDGYDWLAPHDELLTLGFWNLFKERPLALDQHLIKLFLGIPTSTSLGSNILSSPPSSSSLLMQVSLYLTC